MPSSQHSTTLGHTPRNSAPRTGSVVSSASGYTPRNSAPRTGSVVSSASGYTPRNFSRSRAGSAVGSSASTRSGYTVRGTKELPPMSAKLNAEEIEQLFSDYSNTLVQEVMVMLNIPVNASERPEQLTKQQKNRHTLHQATHDQLRKKVLQTTMRANTPLSKQVFDKNESTITATSSLAGIGLTILTSFNPATSAVTGAALTAFFVGYLAREFYMAKKNQAIAKEVEDYLPREDSQILKVISLLTVLLVKDKLDTLLQIKHGIKYSFDTSKLLTLMNSLLNPFPSAHSDDITKSWSNQEQAIAKLAKKYAHEVFKNLVNYVNQKKKGKINDRIFDALIPAFMQNNESLKTTQDRITLTAWLAALSMVVSKEYQHHSEFFYSEVEKLRDQVDLRIEQTAMAQEQDLGDQDRTASWVQRELVEENDSGYDFASLVSQRSSTKSNKPTAPTSTATHAAFHSNRSTTADSERSHCSKRSQHIETTHHSAVRPPRP